MNRRIACIALLFASAFALTASSERKDTLVQPGATFKNEGKEPVYIIYELAPGREFKNTTAVDFMIKSQKDFFRQNFQVELENKIAEQESKVARIKSTVDTLGQSAQTGKKRE